MPPKPRMNIQWSDELKELLVQLDDEIKKNPPKNQGEKLMIEFQAAVSNSDTVSDNNKAIIRGLTSFKTLTANLSKFRNDLKKKAPKAKKGFVWDDASINYLISIYNDVSKEVSEQYIEEVLRLFKQKYPLFTGTGRALWSKVRDEIKQIANTPVKEESIRESSKQIGWLNNIEYSNYLNECASDVRKEYSRHLRRNLKWPKEEIYRRIAELFWHKYPNLGSFSSLKHQIVRMNLLEQHNFGQEPDYEPDSTGDNNMPSSYKNLELYWNYGQKFRQSPLFNSLCYRCGQLLQGKVDGGSKFLFPKNKVDPEVIPIETMYEKLPSHLQYKSSMGNYYACRNCMNNHNNYLAKIYPLTNRDYRDKTNLVFPNISVPEVIADLKTEYEKNEVSLCGFFYNVLKHKQIYRNQYIKIYGEFQATHKRDEHYFRLFSFMNSSIDYQSTRNPDSERKIKRALRWLKENNPHYKCFYSNYETLFRHFGGENPVELYGGLDFNSSKMNVLHKLRGEIETSHLFMPADDFLADDEEMTANPETDILGIQHPIEPLIAKEKIINQTWVKHSDFYLLPKTFPHLYPWGSGGYSEKRKFLSFTFLDYCKMRLYNLDPRWRNSDNFKFYVGDLLMRQRIYYYNQNIVKTSNVNSAMDNTAGKIIDSKNLPYYEQLGHRLPTKLPNSKTFWLDKASNLITMVAEEAPTFFVTLTQNDASPEIQSMFNEGDKIFVASQHGIHSQPITKKGHTVVNNAFESVLYMYKYLKDFMDKFIRNEKSPFGKNTRYFIRAEYQQRGAVHYHILLWSEPGTYDPNGVICAEMPRGEKVDGKYDQHTEHLRQMVRKFNTHKCGTNCYKVVKGRPYKKGEKVCKYGFPFKMTAVEYLEQTGKRYHYIRRQKEDQNIVPYNREMMVHGYRHHNVQKVGPDFKLDYICKYVTKPEKSAKVHLPAKAGAVQKYLARRAVGACEISALLAQIPQCIQSHEVVFLTTELQPKSRVIKRFEHLPKDRDSTDIYYQTKFEKYLSRPTEEPFASMTYPQFYAKYRYITDRSSRIEPRKEDDQNDSDSDGNEWIEEDDDLPVKKTKEASKTDNCFRDSKGRPFKARIHDALTRTKFYFKYGSAQKHWCLQQLMLFETWNETTVDQLKQWAKSAEDLITACIEKNLISDKELDDAKVLIQNAKMRGISRAALESYAEILNEKGIFKENEYDDFKRDLEENDDWVVIDEEAEDGDEPDDLDKRRVIKVNDLEQYVSNFSPTQRKAFDYIRENIESDNQLLLCVAGEAGVGKTHLINALTALFQQEMPDKKFALCATTGCAAVNIQGQTIYNFLKMDINNKTSLAYRTYEAKFIADTDIIIIDEMSMINQDLFYVTEHFLTKFCKPEFNEGAKWGGRHVIMFGDFAQLPAIGKQMFMSPMFLNDFKFMRLTQVMRQESKDFLDILADVRRANYTDAVVDYLNDRNKEFVDKETIKQQVDHIINCRENSKEPIDYENLMILTPTLDQKEEYNSLILAQIEGDIVENEHNEKTGNKGMKGILAHDTLRGSDGRKILESDISWMANLLKSAYPKLLQIKKGAKVLLRRNYDTANGWVNGTIARVTNCFPGTILIQKLDNPESYFPVRQETQVVDRVGKTFTRTQYPIELAYAITIHKCQGMTIKENVYINFDKIFNSQQVYVALSRATKPENVFILKNLDRDNANVLKKLKQSHKLNAILEFVKHRDIIGDPKECHPNWPIPEILVEVQKPNEHANWFRKKKPEKVQKPDEQMDQEKQQDNNELDVDQQTPTKKGIEEVQGAEDTPRKKAKKRDERELSKAVENLNFQTDNDLLMNPSRESAYARQAQGYLNGMINNNAFESMETLLQFWQTYSCDYLGNIFLEYLRQFPARYYTNEHKEVFYLTNIHPEIRAIYEPIDTLGDGSCFYNAISLAITGRQTLMPVIRFALIAIFVQNADALAQLNTNTIRQTYLTQNWNRTGPRHFQIEYTATLVDLAFSAALTSRPNNAQIPQHLKDAKLDVDALDTFEYANQFHMFIASMVMKRPIDNLQYYNQSLAQRFVYSLSIIDSSPIAIAFIAGARHFVCLLPKDEQTRNKQQYTYFCSFLDPAERQIFNARTTDEIPPNELRFADDNNEEIVID